MGQMNSFKQTYTCQSLIKRRAVLTGLAGLSTFTFTVSAYEGRCLYYKFNIEHLDNLLRFIREEYSEYSALISMLTNMKIRDSNEYHIYGGDFQDGGLWNNGKETEDIDTSTLLNFYAISKYGIDRSERYDIEDYFITYLKEVNCEDIPFEISELFEIKIIDTWIEFGNKITLTIEVTNTGSLTATQSIEVNADPLGSEEITVSLDWGESTTEEVAIPITDADGGEYTVSVSSDDDTSFESVSVIAPTVVPTPDKTPTQEQTRTPTQGETPAPAEPTSVSTPSTDTMLDTLRTQTLLWLFTIVTGILGGTAAVYFLQNEDNER